MKPQLLLILAAALSFTACGKNSSSKDESKKNQTYSFTYTYSENGCETKTHNFSNRTDLCQALQDDALNNGCAQSLRKTYFEANCPGEEFQAKPTEPAPSPIPDQVPPTADFPQSNLPKPADVKISLFRDREPLGHDCKQTVFSGTAKELAPAVSITGVQAIVSSIPAYEGYSEMTVYFMAGGFEVSTFKINGKTEALNLIQKKLTRDRTEVKLTESKYCLNQNKDYILVDLVRAPQFDSRKINLSTTIDVVEPNSDKKCEVARTISLRDRVLARYPKADLSAGLNYLIHPSARLSKEGDEQHNMLVENTITLSYGDYSFLGMSFAPDFTHSLLDQLSKVGVENKMTVTTHRECLGSEIDSPLMVRF